MLSATVLIVFVGLLVQDGLDLITRVRRRR